jgi:hypothetical protein
MDNDPIQNTKIINIEVSNKLEAIIKRITVDMSNSFIESVNLDELRKSLKVFKHLKIINSIF